YYRLRKDRIDPWLDAEDLIPGQDWQQAIKKAVRDSDLFIVCLSRNSVNRVGFVQKEIKYAFGSIFIVPLKLEECEVPERLRIWHWVSHFEKDGYIKLRRAFEARASVL